MLNRIKWEEDSVKDGEGSSPNSCHLVWEGTTARRAFGEVKFKVSLSFEVVVAQ